MNKKMREIMASIETKTAQASAFLSDEGKDVEKAAAIMSEVDALKAEFEVMRKIEEAEAADVPEEGIAPVKRDAVAEFAAAARRGFRVNMSDPTYHNEGTPADGGYAVPQDIVVKINARRDAKPSLRDLVSVENVKTMSGRRTFLKRAAMSGFSSVSEAGTIGQMDDMEFEAVSYTVVKYAGYLPVTSELLADADESLVTTIVNWIGDEARVTDNKLILAATGISAPTVNIHGLDDIKSVINVTLGQAFAPTAHIITNDDGLQYLDTLKDEMGRYLLSPDPANPMQMRLAVGPRMIPIDVIPNGTLPTPVTGNYQGIPFIIGDLKEGIKIFDRQQVSIKMSDTASVTSFNAFEQDMVLYRAILREVVKVIDSAAFKACYYTAPETASESSADEGE